jgi:putative ABC transport system permease protein
MDQLLSNTAAQPRLNTVLLSSFAAVALLIASLGIYGVLAYSVSQRTTEIGLRMAMGATPAGILRLIIGEGMRVAIVGVAIGILGGLALGQAMASLVFGVPVSDAATFALVAVTLSGVALAACAIPALRASRIDPMAALRGQ